MQPKSTSLDEADRLAPDGATRCAMLVGGVLSGIALIGVTAVLPQIDADLAHSTTDKLLVKLLGPIIGLSMVIGAPLTGYLIDRIGTRRIFIASCLIYALAGSSGLYLSNLSELLAFRLLVGFAAAAVVIVSITLINQRFDGIERAKWMGYHIATAMLCSLAANPVLGLLGELGWRLPFLIYLIGLPLALVGLAMPRHSSVAPVPRESRHTEAIGHGWSLRWFPLRYIPLALIIGGIVYMPTVYFPFVVRAFGVRSPAIISLIMLADAFIAMIGAFFYGTFQRYISTRTAFILSFGCTGMGMLIVALSATLFGLVAGMLVYGLGVGWFTPNLIMSVSHNLSQLDQARGVGVIKAAHFVSAPVAILAVEPITRITGPMGSIWASAGLSIMALGLLLTRSSSSAWRSWSNRRAVAAAF